MNYCHVSTPVGRLLLAGDEEGLRWISFGKGPHAIHPAKDWRRADESFGDAIAQLEQYFAGKRRHFDLALAPPIGTPFQRSVWSLLTTIPYGETVSYGEMARRLGMPAASRAVGAANGRNPIPIVIPCHRVIGADGSLTGFGGGLAIKRHLLALEGGNSLSLFSDATGSRATPARGAEPALRMRIRYEE